MMMARPKLGETDTERMQLKITRAEIEAIDDWRFANRVPSRSEAVRRLCRIAIVEEDLKPGLHDAAKELLDSVLLLADQTRSERPRRPEEDEELRSLAGQVVLHVYDVYEKLVEQTVRTNELSDGAADLEKALEWERKAADFLQGKSFFESLRSSPEAMAALTEAIERNKNSKREDQ